MQCNVHWKLLCIIYTCNCGNRDDTNSGTYPNKHGTASNQNERIIDAPVIGRFLPKTNITSKFVLLIHAVFVKLNVYLHYVAMGQPKIRGDGAAKNKRVTLNSHRKIYEHLY